MADTGVCGLLYAVSAISSFIHCGLVRFGGGWQIESKNLFPCLSLELEEVLCVIVADVFDHLVYALHLAVRNLAVLHITTYEVA